jgi:hypothetical protein
MKQSILIVLSLILLVPIAIHAQEEDKLYYIHQKQGTEQMLKQYLTGILNENGISTDTLDPVYVNFIPPMGCPRCEGIVIQYNQLLQKMDKKHLIINVLLYKKEKALSEYIRLQNFPGNVLFVDTGDQFLRIFHVNKETVSVPYITKISLKQGKTIIASPTLGIDLNENLVENIISKTTFAEMFLPDDAETSLKSTESESPVSLSLHPDNWKQLFNTEMFLFPIDSCKIPASDTIPIVYTFVLNPAGDKLIIDNSVTNSYTIYSKENKQWVNPIALRPTAEEDTMFIDKSIDPSIYQYFKGINLLVSMYLNAAFTKQNVYLTASLPQLSVVKKDSAMSLEYSNMPVCLVKDYQGRTTHSFLFDEIMENKEYVFLHSGGLFFEDDSLFVFQLQKGWPAVGAEALPKEKENNPFLPEFYDNAKTILFYNAHTRDCTLTAPLDSLYGKYKLGYYINTPLVKKCNNRYYWVDTRLGKISALSNDFQSSFPVCDLLNIDTLLYSMPYSENLLYMESYKPFFEKEIIDFEVLEDNNCVALVTDGSHHYLYRTTKKGKVNITAFPDKIGDKDITGLQFATNSQNNRVVYGLYQSNQEIVVYLFSLSNNIE